MGLHIYSHTDRQTYRLTDKQMDRQTDGQTKYHFHNRSSPVGEQQDAITSHLGEFLSYLIIDCEVTTSNDLQ